MTVLTSNPEQISKDIFEKYYQIIENQKYGDFVTSEYPFPLSYLENIVVAIERSLQDILNIENISLKNRNRINTVVTDLLSNWLSLIICAEGESSYINALAYNLIPVLYSLENLNQTKILEALRHIGKFNPQLDFMTTRPLIAKKIEEIISNFNYIQDTASDTGDFIQMLYKEYKKNTQISSSEELNNILLSDPEYKNYFKPTVLLNFSFEMMNRYNNDTLKLKNNFESIKHLDATAIRTYTKNIKLYEHIERLFEFDDSLDDLIWKIQVKVEAEKYNAAEIGYLLFTFSKSIESIDDVEVELIEWGEGSKWFNLKVRIKNLASKVDIQDLFKNFRQNIEAIQYKKPLDEIKKLEAESNKINAEAEKIKSETKNLMTEEQSNLQNELVLHKDLLDIQAKEIENESKKADVRLKNLEYFKGLADLMKSGIIDNSSDIKVIINDMLLLKKVGDNFTVGDDELLDINESIESKNTNDDIIL